MLHLLKRRLNDEYLKKITMYCSIIVKPYNFHNNAHKRIQNLNTYVLYLILILICTLLLAHMYSH